MNNNNNNNDNKGFASMDPEKQRDIASKGGHAAQESGHAHKLTEEERSEGGSHSGGNFKNDPERASEAGKIGGSR